LATRRSLEPKSESSNLSPSAMADIYEQLIYVQAHCDSKVLHQPGFCEYCDKYPEAQQKRIELGVNFTGGRDEALLQCPAEQARNIEDMYAWGGNQPKGENMPEAYKQVLLAMESEASRMMYGWGPDNATD
jgi:hypothetical protein